MRIFTFAVVFALALGSAALGEEEASAWARAAAAYQAGPTGERLTVRLSDDTGSVEETLTVWSDPGRASVIELGGIRAALTRHVLVAVREGDSRRAFVAPVSGDAGETLAEHLRGAPAIPAALAMGGTAGSVWPLSVAEDPVVVLTKTGRLSLVSASLGDGRSVSIRFEALDPADAPAWGVSLEGRSRVSSLASLAEFDEPVDTGRVRVGDDAPMLLLLTLEVRPWTLRSRESGAVVLTLCRGRTPGASAGYGASLDVAEDDDAPLGFSAEIGVCGPPFGGDMLAYLRGVRDLWGGDVKWSVSPETTIDRFAPGAQAAVVVIDAFDTVRAVIPLDGRGNEQTAIAGEIREALGLAEADQETSRPER